MRITQTNLAHMARSGGSTSPTPQVYLTLHKECRAVAPFRIRQGGVHRRLPVDLQGVSSGVWAHQHSPAHALLRSHCTQAKTPRCQLHTNTTADAAALLTSLPRLASIVGKSGSRPAEASANARWMSPSTLCSSPGSRWVVVRCWPRSSGRQEKAGSPFSAMFTCGGVAGEEDVLVGQVDALQCSRGHGNRAACHFHCRLPCSSC